MISLMGSVNVQEFIFNLLIIKTLLDLCVGDERLLELAAFTPDQCDAVFGKAQITCSVLNPSTYFYSQHYPLGLFDAKKSPLVLSRGPAKDYWAK